MFSTGGTFLGTVLETGVQMLGNPVNIRWCNKTRSLHVAHYHEDNPVAHHLEDNQLYSISNFRC